jgi:hypothetical protein
VGSQLREANDQPTNLVTHGDTQRDSGEFPASVDKIKEAVRPGCIFSSFSSSLLERSESLAWEERYLKISHGVYRNSKLPLARARTLVANWCLSEAANFESRVPYIGDVMDDYKQTINDGNGGLEE